MLFLYKFKEEAKTKVADKIIETSKYKWAGQRKILFEIFMFLKGKN